MNRKHDDDFKRATIKKVLDGQPLVNRFQKLLEMSKPRMPNAFAKKAFGILSSKRR